MIEGYSVQSDFLTGHVGVFLPLRRLHLEILATVAFKHVYQLNFSVTSYNYYLLAHARRSPFRYDPYIFI